LTPVSSDSSADGLDTISAHSPAFGLLMSLVCCLYVCYA
jgi:hypothetical protein